jgi:hypothetical protein
MASGRAPGAARGSKHPLRASKEQIETEDVCLAVRGCGVAVIGEACFARLRAVSAVHQP